MFTSQRFRIDQQNALNWLMKKEEYKNNKDKALKEIFLLTNSQLQCLIRLYHMGLRGHHLRNWHKKKDDNMGFSDKHSDALSALIIIDKIKPDKAIMMISHLSEEEVQFKGTRTLVI